jgi:hypothetical protein
MATPWHENDGSRWDAMRLLARLVSGIFKNILEMIVKCILQRLGARARDSDICQCWMPQTQSPTSMCSWRFAVIDLPELDSRYQITANSEDEVIVTSLWKPIPNSNVQAQLIWCGWIGADTVLEFNMPRFDQRIQQVGNLWLDLIKIALAGLCLAGCLLWWGSRYWHAYWLVWLHIYWMEDSALSGCVNIPSICICHRT